MSGSKRNLINIVGKGHSSLHQCGDEHEHVFQEGNHGYLCPTHIVLIEHWIVNKKNIVGCRHDCPCNVQLQTISLMIFFSWKSATVIFCYNINLLVIWITLHIVLIELGDEYIDWIQILTSMKR